jgi:hypothetical protein
MKRYLRNSEVKNLTIKACISCGSRSIRSGTISDGMLPGYTDGLVAYVCDECNHRGIPVIFDSEEEWEKFRKARLEDRKEGH